MNGNHEGHDYALITTSSGMCDCGDPDSWKESGFCKHHKGPLQDPTDHLSPELKAIMEDICAAFVTALYSLRMDSAGESTSINDMQCIVILKEMEKYTKQSPAFKRIMHFAMEKMIDAKDFKAEEIVHQPDEDQTEPLYAHNAEHFGKRSYLDIFLEMHTEMNPDVRLWLFNVYSAMVSDAAFKKYFAKLFTKHFKQFVIAAVQEEEQQSERSILNITVQLLTVPTVVDGLVKEDALLEKMMDILLTATQGSLEQVEPVEIVEDEAMSRNTVPLQKIKLDDGVIHKNGFWHFLYDLGYVTMHNHIAHQLLVDNDSREFDQYLQFFSYFHKAVEVRRIDSDNDDWRTSFSFEMRIFPKLFRYLADGLACIKVQHSAGDTHMRDIDTEEVAIGSDMVDQMEWRRVLQVILRTITDRLRSLLDREAMQWHTIPIPHGPLRIVNHESINGPLSFNLPMHRVLATLLSNVVTLFPDFTLEDLILHNMSSATEKQEYLLQLLEHPLRCIVASYQVRRRLWQRNHMHIIDQVYNYDRFIWSDYTICNDIFLIQAIYVLLGPELFFANCIDRFRGRDILFRFTNDKDEDDINAHLEEDFITFILMLFNERSYAGHSSDDAIRDFIIHNLFRSDKLTFSRIKKAVPKRFRIRGIGEGEGSSEIVERVLQEVADFHKPASTNEEGFFKVKKECWKRYNPYSIVYNQADIQLVETNYKKYHKQVRLTLCQPVRPFAAMRSLMTLLHCEALHRVLYVTLYRIHVQVMSGAKFFERTATSVLHTFIYALESYTDDSVQATISKEGQFNSGIQKNMKPLDPDVACSFDIAMAHKSDILHNIRHKVSFTDGTSLSLLDMLLNMSSANKEFREQKYLFDRIFQNLSDMDQSCAEFITTYTSQRSTSAPTLSKEDLRKRRLAAAKKRQQGLMKQFRAKQSQFDGSSMAQDLLEEEEEMAGVAEDETDYFAGRKCAFCHSNISPGNRKELAMFTHLTSSRVPQVVSEQNYVECFGTDENPASELEMPALSHLHKRKPANIGPNRHLFADVNVGKGIQMNNCGHVCHSDCFDSYLEALRTRQHFKGQQFLDVRNGEIICPLCSKISNSLCPFVTRNADSVPDIFAEYLGQRSSMSVQLTTPESSSSLSPSADTPMSDVSDTKDESSSSNIETSVELSTGGAVSSDPIRIVEQEHIVSYLKSEMTYPTKHNIDKHRAIIFESMLESFYNSVIMRVFSLDPLRGTLAATLSEDKYDPSIMHNMVAFNIVTQEIAQRNDGLHLRALPLPVSSSLRVLIQAVFAHQVGSEERRHFSKKRYELLVKSVTGEKFDVPLLSRQTAAGVLRHFRHTLTMLEDEEFWGLSDVEEAKEDEDEEMGDEEEKHVREQREHNMQKEMSKLMPILLCDPFTILVKLSLLRPDLMSDKNRFFGVIRLLYMVQIVQALVVRKQMKRSSSPSETEDGDLGITRALRYVNGTTQSMLEEFSVPEPAESQTEQWNRVAEMDDMLFVKLLCLSFVRRTSLFTSILFPDEPVPLFQEHDIQTDHDIDPNIMQELQHDNLANNYLHLPPMKTCIESLSNVDHFENHLFKCWIHQLRDCKLHGRTSTDVPQELQQMTPISLIPRLSIPRPFHFIVLPRLYQTLFLRYHESKCPNCDRRFHQPSLCLVSGAVVPTRDCRCFRDHPERRRTSGLRRLDMVTRHANQNFAGVGLFLVIPTSNILLRRETRWSDLPSPYLDQYGESDIGLSRGCALYLDQSRLDVYLKKFILTSFDQDTVILNTTVNFQLRW